MNNKACDYFYDRLSSTMKTFSSSSQTEKKSSISTTVHFADVHKPPVSRSRTPSPGRPCGGKSSYRKLAALPSARPKSPHRHCLSSANEPAIVSMEPTLAPCLTSKKLPPATPAAIKPASHSNSVTFGSLGDAKKVVPNFAQHRRGSATSSADVTTAIRETRRIRRDFESNYLVSSIGML